MPQFLEQVAVTAACYLVLNASWLALTLGRFYRPYLGGLLRDRMRLFPSLTFYVIYAFALTVLAVAPALNAHAPVEAFWRGGLIGLAAYGAYNLTNDGTLRDWPRIVTLVDLGWGAFATGLASFASALVLSRI